MMLQREPAPRNGYCRDTSRLGRRAGSQVFTVVAGVAVLFVGTTAAALGGAYSAARSATVSQCQAMASPENSQPPVRSPARASSTPAPAGVALAELCVSVQPVTSTVEPGQAALYNVRVWRVGLAAAGDVTVRISVTSRSSSPGFPAPVFTGCGMGNGTQTCAVGVLGAGQAAPLQAQVPVPGSAPAGDAVTLSAAVTGTLLGVISVGSVTGTATVDVVTGAPSPPPSTQPSSPPPRSGHPSSPPPGGGHPGSPSSGGGHSSSPSSGGGPHGPGSARSPLGIGLGGTPAVGNEPLSPGSGGSGPGVNPVGLFPVIYPSPSPSGSGRSQLSGTADGRYHAMSVPGILPLSIRQATIQVAGLIVLDLGIIAAIARVSLRQPRAPQGKQ